MPINPLIIHKCAIKTVDDNLCRNAINSATFACLERSECPNSTCDELLYGQTHLLHDPVLGILGFNNGGLHVVASTVHHK